MFLQNNPKFQIISLIILVLIVSGCHTIRPAAVADDGYLGRLAKSPKSIFLVLDNDYRSYISTDRGNDLADPQTYYVGEALAPLTETFFSTAYAHVKTGAALPSGNELQECDFIVYPRIGSFTNELGMLGGKQTIQVRLVADIYNKNKNQIGQAMGLGSITANLGAAAIVFGSTKKCSQTVNWALQDALISLTNGVIEKTG